MAKAEGVQKEANAAFVQIVHEDGTVCGCIAVRDGDVGLDAEDFVVGPLPESC